jgi:hypothetical protein
MQEFQMTLFSFRHSSPVIALLICVAACSSSDINAPESRSTADLRLLHVAKGTPSLVATHVSFYAVKGIGSGVDLYFRPLPGNTDSLRLLSFRMGANSLAYRADGSPIAQGDSVLISLTVSDPYHLVVDFQPSGLRFADADQPVLDMSWEACGADLNYDGTVDAADDTIASQLAVWRQEDPALPWFRQTGLLFKDIHEVKVQLSGFTGYALAY